METTFFSQDDHATPNRAVIQDSIIEKISKAKSILTCIMFSAEFLREDMEIDNHTFYHALWAVDEYLEELEKLFEQI